MCKWGGFLEVSGAGETAFCDSYMGTRSSEQPGGKQTREDWVPIHSATSVTLHHLPGEHSTWLSSDIFLRIWLGKALETSLSQMHKLKNHITTRTWF